MTNPSGQTTNFTYDAANRLTRKDYHSGAYTTYAYDAANRLLTLANKNSSDTTLSSYTYEYDSVGNRVKMTEADGGETTYAYDDLYRLTGVTYPDSTSAAYTYDAVGNRIKLVEDGATTNYTYDAADRLLTAGSVTDGWDENGNQISKTDATGTTTYAYDYENRLTSITFPDSSTNSFIYYPDGRRLSKTEKSGAKINYFYDGLNTVVETDSGGTTVARYTGVGIDDWISMDRGGSSYYYLKDALGSATGLTDTSENVVATYQYDAFGIIKSETGSVVNPYKFTGREYDVESGLYYYRVRYYNPEVGRFLINDPNKEIRGVNSYSYVGNNPINYVDPLGLDRKACLAGCARSLKTCVKWAGIGYGVCMTGCLASCWIIGPGCAFCAVICSAGVSVALGICADSYNDCVAGCPPEPPPPPPPPEPPEPPEPEPEPTPPPEPPGDGNGDGGGNDDGDQGSGGEKGADNVPELPTVILFAIGLITLAGYVWLNRRKTK